MSEIVGKGYQENVSIDEGMDAYGYRTRVHFEGSSVITQQTYDAEPLLREAQAIREATEGTRWGDGQHVGVLPMHEAIRILRIRGRAEQQKAIRLFFQANPLLCGNSKYLRAPTRESKAVREFTQQILASQAPTLVLPE
jgi:hypothetical protein